MGKTEQRGAPDLGFDVEIVSGGRAQDAGAPAASGRTLSPARIAAKTEARHRRNVIIAASASK